MFLEKRKDGSMVVWYHLGLEHFNDVSRGTALLWFTTTLVPTVCGTTTMVYQVVRYHLYALRNPLYFTVVYHCLWYAIMITMRFHHGVLHSMRYITMLYRRSCSTAPWYRMVVTHGASLYHVYHSVPRGKAWYFLVLL